MELKLNLEYTQILNLIRQLSKQDIDKLYSDMHKEFDAKKEIEDITSLQKLLLKGPTWIDEEYNTR